MKKRTLYLLGTVLLVAFGGFALSSFQQALRPYVSFTQAKSLDRTLQVAGALEKGSSSYEESSQSLLFTLREPDTGETIRVQYHGVKPGNFEDAISIVAIGHYDRSRDLLEAEKLLVKCPSKYQGLEESEVKTYS
jgi:cytochrome c-type biogenesis protein CcmE